MIPSLLRLFHTGQTSQRSFLRSFSSFIPVQIWTQWLSQIRLVYIGAKRRKKFHVFSSFVRILKNTGAKRRRKIFCFFPHLYEFQYQVTEFRYFYDFSIPAQSAEKIFPSFVRIWIAKFCHLYDVSIPARSAREKFYVFSVICTYWNIRIPPINRIRLFYTGAKRRRKFLHFCFHLYVFE